MNDDVAGNDDAQPRPPGRWSRLRGRLGGAGSYARAQTASAARVADTVRERIITEACGALEYTARMSAGPLRVVGLAPLVPVVPLLVVAAIGGTEARVLSLVLVAVALVLSGNLFWRRRRMLAAIEPPQALAREVATALDLADAWGSTAEALTGIRVEHARRQGWFRHLRSVLSTVKLGQQLTSRVSDLSRVAPFLPPSLSLTWASVVAAVAGTAVLTGLALLLLLLALLGAV